MMASVSVVIPVYNGERYIRETLKSVFAQTYQDREIICVDDGSEDASLKILKEIQESKESKNRIQVVQQPNMGQAGARNAGAKRGTGTYLAFLDQDDLWLPHKLERQVAVLESNPDTVMVHCDMDMIDELGRVTDQTLVSTTQKSVQKGPSLSQLFGWDPCINPSTMLIRRAAFDRIGGFDSELSRWGDDVDLMLRLKREGRFVFLEETGTQYRKHSTNFSGSGSDLMFRCADKFLQRLMTRYACESKRKKALLHRMLAQVYSDWGKMKMRSGSQSEAQHLLLRSLRYYPWKFRTYSRLIRTVVPKF
jgi:GT2 family glycosyltransferase